MNKEQFLAVLADILDETEVSGGQTLADFDGWDSLSILSIVSLADSKFGFTLTFSEVRKLTTVDDLWNYFESKKVK